MHGKTVLITGGTAGLGQATAIALARQGASVVITARDEARGRTAVAAINRRANAAPVRLISLDLASFASVRGAAERFLGEHPRLDVLINNAGVFAARLEHTREGFELQFGVNHLGPFLLSHLLLPPWKRLPHPGSSTSPRGHITPVKSILTTCVAKNTRIAAGALTPDRN